ncbi:VOC family protein [Dactylosporangium sp. NPDC048998]|uniref:VOC family protein n=1 Tax=Dactylosporangium sp. NPDC048998 TaxID=3363976 RepID=UPI0037189FE1
MAIVQQFGYLSIGVRDLREGVEFYSRFARLDLTERIGDTAFMTGGLEHHWIRLEQGNHQGVKRVGYELASDDAFDVVRAGLQQWGIEYEEGGSPQQDRVQRWMRFTDPGGTAIELYRGMYERGVAPVNNGVNIEKFLHGGWETANFDQTTKFYQEVLGFKASDWIGDKVGFFRAGDKFHHSAVMLRSNRSAFNHFCIQVESLDDVMRFRNNALRHGVKLRDDLLRHAPSGSIGVYMKDEARGFAVEYCVGHPRIEDEHHKARILPMSPETADVWRSPLPEIVIPDMGLQEVDSLSAMPEVGSTGDPRSVAARTVGNDVRETVGAR